jgi:hypothetical protein
MLKQKIIKKNLTIATSSATNIPAGINKNIARPGIRKITLARKIFLFFSSPSRFLRCRS